MAVEYRKWLLHEIFDLIFSLETHALKPDANLVLNLIDGLMFQILSSKSLEEGCGGGDVSENLII